MKVAPFVRLLLVLLAFLCASCLVQPPDNRGLSDDDDTSDDDDVPILTGTFFGDLEGSITVEDEEFSCLSWGVVTFGGENRVQSGMLRCEADDGWATQELEVDLTGLQVPAAQEVEEVLWGLPTFVRLNIVIEQGNSRGLSVDWTGFGDSWTSAGLAVTGVLRAEP